MWNFALNIESPYFGWEPGSVPGDVRDITAKGTGRNKASTVSQWPHDVGGWKRFSKEDPPLWWPKQTAIENA
jgi:hypothetical protein